MGLHAEALEELTHLCGGKLVNGEARELPYAVLEIMADHARLHVDRLNTSWGALLDMVRHKP